MREVDRHVDEIYWVRELPVTVAEDVALASASKNDIRCRRRCSRRRWPGMHESQKGQRTVLHWRATHLIGSGGGTGELDANVHESAIVMHPTVVLGGPLEGAIAQDCCVKLQLVGMKG